MNQVSDTASADSFDWITGVPWLLMVAAILPFVIAAWRSKTYPSVLLISLMLFPIVLGLFTILAPSVLILVLAFDAAVATFALIDYCFLPPLKATGIKLIGERSMPRTVSINIATDAEFTLLNRTGWTYRGSVCDDLPEGFIASPKSHELHLPPMAKVTYRRKVTGQRRGAYEFQRIYIETHSPLRFWRRHVLVPVESRVNVYPDMKQLAEYAILARTDRLTLIGVRKTRRVGQDSEFERLRDYSPDDNYRHIDWRTTARRNKLTVRQFQSDQSQRVMFLLDCGRMMTNERSGMSLLDHSLNAALMMGYVALAQGDSVGMLCFSDSVHAYIPPRGGKNQLNRLLQAGFDQFPRLVESRYDQAFLHLSNHCKRRTLVVLMTNLIDEVNAGQVVDYLGNLVGRHLPLGVLLRDRQIFDSADHPSEEPDQLYRSAVAAEILCWREQVIRDIRHRGSLVLDVFPEEMTAPLVNQYLQVKAQHLL